MEVFTRCENLFLLLKQEFRPSSCCLCFCCCWQLVQQVQMKVLWSWWTSHLFEPPWINDQGKEVQTTFYDHLSRSSVGRQGGRQFFPRRPAHPRREVVRNFGSEALYKGKCREAERRGWVTLIYYLDQYISLLETKISFSGKTWSKMDLT